MKTPADVAAYEAETAVEAARLAAKAAKRAEAPVREAEAKERVARLQWAVDAVNWVSRRWSPARNRWPDLAEYDERVDEVGRILAERTEELNELRQALATAPQEDAQALADWRLAGETGPRPEPSAAAIEARIETLELEVAAGGLERTNILDQKTAYVEKHRGSLVRDANADTNAARARVHALIGQLEQARQELIECRKTELWARLYPHEAMNQDPGVVRAVALGLRKPLESALGLAVQVDAAKVFGLLHDDADVIAEARTGDQEAAMRGASLDDLRFGDSAGTWVGTPEHQAAMRRERDEARKRYEQEWGGPPAGGW